MAVISSAFDEADDARLDDAIRAAPLRRSAILAGTKRPVVNLSL
jgi:hypothetical protein